MSRKVGRLFEASSQHPVLRDLENYVVAIDIFLEYCLQQNFESLTGLTGLACVGKIVEVGTEDRPRG